MKIKAPKVTGADFTATEFDTAEVKAKFLVKLCNWVIAGMPRSGFDKNLYRGLSLHFNHIAHYNIDGFYDVWASNPNVRHEFITYHRQNPLYGSAAYTWVDVQVAFRTWIIDSGIITEYAQASRAYREQENIALARRAISELSDEAKAALILVLLPKPTSGDVG